MNTVLVVTWAAFGAGPLPAASPKEQAAAALIERAGGRVFRGWSLGPVHHIDFFAVKPDARAATSLASFPALRHVGLPASWLKDRVGVRLGPGVTSLSLYLDGPSPEGLRRLGRQLEDVSVSGEEGIPLAVVKVLAGMPRLRALEVCCEMPRGGIRELAKSRALTEFSCTSLGDEDEADLRLMGGLRSLVLDEVSGLGFLRGLKELRSLHLGLPTEMADDAFIPLAGLVRLTKVEVKGRGLKGKWFRHLVKAPIRALTVSGLGEEAFPHIGRLQTLEELKVKRCRLDDAGMRHLAGLKNLRALDAQFDVPRKGGPAVTFGDEGMAALRGMPRLEELNLWRTNVGDAGLAHLTRCRRLRDLSIGHSPVTGSGLAHLAGHPSLRVLHISDSPLEDRHLRHIGRLPALERLWLLRCGITGSGLKGIGSLKQLESVLLEGRELRDAVLAHLGEVESLKGLFLEGGKLTDRGLKHLHRLVGLDYITLRYVGVTKDGVELLKVALPTTQIFMVTEEP
jgi:hypothetical protein